MCTSPTNLFDRAEGFRHVFLQESRDVFHEGILFDISVCRWEGVGVPLEKKGLG